MALPKLGIVSSYDEQCGNASYTHVLKQEFSRYYDVEVIAVKPTLLSHPRRKEYLRDLCARIRDCDMVNIQFEAGLYGESPRDIAANVCAMIASARTLIFTMHRVHIPPRTRTYTLQLAYELLQFRNIAGVMRGWRGHWLVGRMAYRIAAALKRKHRADPSSITVMVHTKRERTMLEREWLESRTDRTFVVDYPITFLNRSQIAEHVERRAEIRDAFLRHYRLDPSYKYIGIFGFLSENKGHHIAIEALRFLPPEYRLLIFGGQHPMSITPYDFGHMLNNPDLFLRNKHPYIASLIDLARQVVTEDGETPPAAPTEQRVQFLGVIDDAEFIRGVVAMDFVVLPYLESGQGGSANASLVLELQARSVLSRNHAFMELARYYPGCFAMVDMANPMQLAQTIYRWQDDLTPMQRDATARYNIENNVLIHRRAFEQGAASADMLKNELLAQADALPAWTAEQDDAAIPSHETEPACLDRVVSGHVA